MRLPVSPENLQTDTTHALDDKNGMEPYSYREEFPVPFSNLPFSSLPFPSPNHMRFLFPHPHKCQINSSLSQKGIRRMVLASHISKYMCIYTYITYISYDVLY